MKPFSLFFPPRPAYGFSRVTSHGLYRRPGRRVRRQVTASRFTAAHYCPPLPGSPAAKLLLATMARYCRAFLPPGHGLPAHNGPLLPTSCPSLPMSARYCSLIAWSKSPRTVSDFRTASRRAPWAAAPVASGLDPLRWTRMDTQLPPLQQKHPSFVLIRSIRGE